MCIYMCEKIRNYIYMCKNNNICIHILDARGGFGNRILREPIAYFLAYYHKCTLAIHWGNCQNHSNYFIDMFENSNEVIGCR